MLMRTRSGRETRVPRDGFPGIFLTRLERLVDLRPATDLPFNAESLLRHAIYATYVDCRELGLDQPAQALMARLER